MAVKSAFARPFPTCTKITLYSTHSYLQHIHAAVFQRPQTLVFEQISTVWSNTMPPKLSSGMHPSQESNPIPSLGACTTIPLTKTASFTPQGKGKHALPGEGVKNYLARKEAKEAARRAQINPDPSIELPLPQIKVVGAGEAVATPNPNLGQAEHSPYDEHQIAVEEDSDQSVLDISIRLGTESTRDSLSQQAPELPRAVVAHSKAGALRIQQHAQSLRQITGLRTYIDDHTFSGSVTAEWELLEWTKIGIVNQKKILIHAENRASMALSELQVLLRRARVFPQVPYKLKSFAAEILSEDVAILDLNTLHDALKDPALGKDPRLSHTIVAVAKIYHIIKGKQERYEEEAAQWYLLRSWINDKNERLKYEVGEEAVGLEDMYICARILKEGACFIQEELDASIKEWTELRRQGVMADRFTELSFTIVNGDKGFTLKLLPEGYDDIWRFEPAEIRATNLEGEGSTIDLRRQTDLKRFLKSLAIRTKSLHQVRSDLEVLNDLREAEKGISETGLCRGRSK